MNLSMNKYNMADSRINEAILNMVELFGIENHKHKQCFMEMFTTIAKFAEESVDLGDMKMINTTLKELRYSFKLFSHYRDTRKVCLFGSARVGQDLMEYQMAEDFAKKITAKGFMLITGAGSGIMEAGNKGAEIGRSFGVNIQLPFEQNANPYIADDSKLITYKYFFNRKVVFIKESDATVLFPGGLGTHDEGFENLTLIQTGKCSPRPIVMVESPDNTYWDDWFSYIKNDLLAQKYIAEEDLNLFRIVKNVDDAVNFITKFYSVYHSIRYRRNASVMRLNKEISDSLLKNLNEKFADILINGKIEKVWAKDLNFDSDIYPDKPRLIFNFNRHNYGRLLEMIHFINAEEN